MGDAGARIDAGSVGGGPRAAKVGGALSGSGVVGLARHDTGVGGGRRGAQESGGFDFAASVAVGTALSERLVGALELALEVDEFALGVGVAESGGADTLASGSAGAGDGVPHAVGRLAVAILLVVEAQ